jgi:hypothetical protein
MAARPDLGLVATAAALPASLVDKVVAVTSEPSLGIVVKLSGEPFVVIGSTSSLEEKMVSLVTMLGDQTALVGTKEIDLRVPSSPVLTP